MIGEELESIDKLRQRASEAHDLILYYNEFAAGDTSRLVYFSPSGQLYFSLTQITLHLGWKQ